MFWLVMTVVTSVLAVAYLVVAALGEHRRMPVERRRAFHTSGVLLVGWAAVCGAHWATSAR
jgi:hypothetical protein